MFFCVLTTWVLLQDGTRLAEPQSFIGHPDAVLAAACCGDRIITAGAKDLFMVRCLICGVCVCPCWPACPITRSLFSFQELCVQPCNSMLSFRATLRPAATPALLHTETLLGQGTCSAAATCNANSMRP